MTHALSVSATSERTRPGLSGGSLRRRLFGISPDEARFERRGFAAGTPSTQRRLEEVGRTFIGGYLAGLEAERPESLGPRLSAVAAEDRGFAYEGAAMAFALLDLLTPWRHDRFARFLAGPGEPHVYMVHVGAGWAMARLRRPLERAPLGLHSLLAPLALDGFGFHEGYFSWQRTFAARQGPSRLRDDAARAFDQGLGRSLWFVACGDAARIASRIDAFAADRRPDLWSGVGLAAAYAGGVESDTLIALRDHAGCHLPHVAQGVAFAAKARARAQNPAAHTELACRILAGRSAAEAARITDLALAALPGAGADDYEGWRRGIRERLSA